MRVCRRLFANMAPEIDELREFKEAVMAEIKYKRVLLKLSGEFPGISSKPLPKFNIICKFK